MEAVAERQEAQKASTKVQEVGLGTFITFAITPDNKLEVEPAPRAIYKKENGNYVLEVGDIPLPAGVVHPKNALTLLYGFQDALQEMKMQYAAARARGHELLKVEFRMSVGMGIDHKQGTVTMETVHQSRFLNLTRADKLTKKDPNGVIIGKRAIIDLLHDRMNEMLRAEANSRNEVAVLHENFLDACARADILCDAIRSIPEFSHINTVVYCVPDGSPRGRKIATIFETKSKSSLAIRGTAPFEIALPDLG